MWGPSHVTNPSKFQCEICELYKSHCVSFPVQNKKFEILFSIINSDVLRPSHVTSYSFRWFVSFIDDCTHITWMYLLKMKFEAVAIFKSFYAMIQNQFHTKMKVFLTNNGKELFNNILGSYFLQNGLFPIPHVSIHLTKWSNGEIKHTFSRSC